MDVSDRNIGIYLQGTRSPGRDLSAGLPEWKAAMLSRALRRVTSVHFTRTTPISGGFSRATLSSLERAVI
jgi:hypothetical protein